MISTAAHPYVSRSENGEVDHQVPELTEAGLSARPLIDIAMRRLLLIFLRRPVYEENMNAIDTGLDRPNIGAAKRVSRAFQRCCGDCRVST